MDKLLSIGQVAKRLGVSVDVVRSLDDRGELKGRRTPGGHRRYLPADVDSVIARQRARRSRTQTDSPRKPPARRLPSPVREPPPPEPPYDDFGADEDVISMEDLRAEAEREAAKQRAAAETKARAAAAGAENQRLEALKKYGRDLARWLPPDWLARVVEALEEFVIPKRVPPTLAPWEAQQLVRSRVEAIKQQYSDAEDQRRKREDDQRKIDWLIAWGHSYATSETILGWDTSERERARREVESELKEKVKPDMTQGHVKDLVDDVLSEWDDDTDDHDDDDDYEEEDDEQDDDDREG